MKKDGGGLVNAKEWKLNIKYRVVIIHCRKNNYMI